ncbi:unnamed protein product [Amoebophrya sp. A120]|nr:unnamed protein product [Amoebophrya sp. A120]|eukprot:GSA120T00003907001.1
MGNTPPESPRGEVTGTIPGSGVNIYDQNFYAAAEQQQLQAQQQQAPEQLSYVIGGSPGAGGGYGSPYGNVNPNLPQAGFPRERHIDSLPVSASPYPIPGYDPSRDSRYTTPVLQHQNTTRSTTGGLTMAAQHDQYVLQQQQSQQNLGNLQYNTPVPYDYSTPLPPNHALPQQGGNSVNLNQYPQDYYMTPGSVMSHQSGSTFANMPATSSSSYRMNNGSTSGTGNSDYYNINGSVVHEQTVSHQASSYSAAAGGPGPADTPNDYPGSISRNLGSGGAADPNAKFVSRIFSNDLVFTPKKQPSGTAPGRISTPATSSSLIFGATAGSNVIHENYGSAAVVSTPGGSASGGPGAPPPIQTGGSILFGSATGTPAAPGSAQKRHQLGFDYNATSDSDYNSTLTPAGNSSILFPSNNTSNEQLDRLGSAGQQAATAAGMNPHQGATALLHKFPAGNRTSATAGDGVEPPLSQEDEEMYRVQFFRHRSKVREMEQKVLLLRQKVAEIEQAAALEKDYAAERAEVADTNLKLIQEYDEKIRVLNEQTHTATMDLIEEKRKRIDQKQHLLQQLSASQSQAAMEEEAENAIPEENRESIKQAEEEIDRLRRQHASQEAEFEELKDTAEQEIGALLDEYQKLAPEDEEDVGPEASDTAGTAQELPPGMNEASEDRASRSVKDVDQQLLDPYSGVVPPQDSNSAGSKDHHFSSAEAVRSPSGAPIPSASFLPAVVGTGSVLLQQQAVPGQHYQPVEAQQGPAVEQVILASPEVFLHHQNASSYGNTSNAGGNNSNSGFLPGSSSSPDQHIILSSPPDVNATQQQYRVVDGTAGTTEPAARVSTEFRTASRIQLPIS